MSNWKKVRLGDMCSYESSRTSVGTLDLWSYISTENMLPNRGGVTVASSLPSTANAIKFRKGQVLVSNIRPYFKKIWRAAFDGGCSNDVLCFDLEDGIDERYFYYLLSQDAFFDYVLAGSKGTKMPRGDKKQIMNFEFSLPSLEEQRRIAGILGALDDKIEVNNRINRNLEQQAESLFRRWFVDFEFPDTITPNNPNGTPYLTSGGTLTPSPLGPIPLGWSVGTLGDYCKVRSGFAFKSAWWKDDGVKVLKIKNIESNNTINLNDCSYVDNDKIIVAKDFIANAGDILIAMTGATIGKYAIIPKIDETLLVNQRVGKFFLGDNPIEKLPFLYCLLKQESIISEIINRGQGSAQPNISSADIETVNIAMPRKQLLEDFNIKTKAFFELMIKNTAENQTLAQMRDALLPKLMNNEFKL